MCCPKTLHHFVVSFQKDEENMGKDTVVKVIGRRRSITFTCVSYLDLTGESVTQSYHDPEAEKVTFGQRVAFYTQLCPQPFLYFCKRYLLYILYLFLYLFLYYFLSFSPILFQNTDPKPFITPRHFYIFQINHTILW